MLHRGAATTKNSCVKITKQQKEVCMCNMLSSAANDLTVSVLTLSFSGVNLSLSTSVYDLGLKIECNTPNYVSITV